jgi:hypothetical protein
MAIRELAAAERSFLKETVPIWDCRGVRHVWTPTRQKKWVLEFPIPRIEGGIRIEENSYYLGGNNCPCALYCLDGRLKPILSGSIEVWNYWATDLEADQDPENSRYEIRKILGISVPDKKVVIEYLWDPICTGIVEACELIEHAPQLWEYFIQRLNQIRNVLSRMEPSWDLFVIEYFLNENDDLKIPRAEKYWIEMEVDNGEVEQPVEPDIEIIEPSPGEKLMGEMMKLRGKMAELEEKIFQLQGIDDNE